MPAYLRVLSPPVSYPTWRRVLDTLIGTPSRGARLAGGGIGAHVIAPPREASTKVALGSPLRLGAFGLLSFTCWPATRTPTSHPCGCKSASRNTGGNAAATGGASRER